MSLSATTLLAGGVLFATALLGSSSHTQMAFAFDVVARELEDGLDEVVDSSSQIDVNNLPHEQNGNNRPHVGRRHHRRPHKAYKQEGESEKAELRPVVELPPPLRAANKGKAGRHSGKGHQKHQGEKGAPLKQKGTKRFDVSFERLLQSPVLTNAFSTSTFNYNSAYVPHVGTDSHDNLPRDCLAVRVQNYTSTSGSARSSLSPSALFSHAKNLFTGKKSSDASSPKEPHLGAGYIGPSSISIICENSYDYPFAKEDTWVVLDPSQADFQALGTEDPRVVYLPQKLETDEFKARRQQREKQNGGATPQPNPNRADGTLLMYYTAVNNHTNTHGVTAMLSLALCHLSLDPRCTNWELRGPILKDRTWTKSGAMLIVPEKAGRSPSDSPQQHYLLFGDSDIWVATTTDFLNYNDTGATLMTTRDEPTFDSALIESGPPPELLSDNESYIFLYNSARIANIPNPDPNWNLQYNLGYAILGLPPADSVVPTVIQRADVPILSPELGWETCNNASGVPGLTADVVFVEGMKRLHRGKNTNTDSFLVYYQGADARMGIGLLTIDIVE